MDITSGNGSAVIVRYLSISGGKNLFYLDMERLLKEVKVMVESRRARRKACCF